MNDLISYHVAMVVEYAGSNFYGFQKQKTGVRTIQHELEVALSKFANHPINIVSAGRTDSKVHAFYQVISFITFANRKLSSWVQGVNALLPLDIVVHEAKFTEPSFNARFSTLSRTYHYYLLVNPVRCAILAGKIGWCPNNLNVTNMLKAGCQLIGENDFSSFRAANCQAITAVKTLTQFNITVKQDILRFEFTANAFLYHMVRNIMGALIYVGRGKLSIDEFIKLLQAKNRTFAPPTFMPDGLYLAMVDYGFKLFSYMPRTWIM